MKRSLSKNNKYAIKKCQGIVRTLPVSIAKLKYDYEDQLQYSEEYWKPEETFCHSDPGEIPLPNAGVKNS